MDTNEKKQPFLNEEELRRNLEIASLGEQLAGLGFFEHNWQTGKGYWSEGFYKLLRIKPEDINCTHTNFLKFVHKDDFKRVTDHIKTCLKKQTAMDIKFRIVQADGNVIDIHGIGKSFFESIGKPIKTVGTFQDITETKKLLSKNQESIDELSFLNRIIISVQNQKSLDEICEVIAKEVSSFYPDNIIAVSLYDNNLGGVRVRAIEGVGKKYRQFAKTLGKDPKKMVFDAKELDKTYEHYTSGSLIKVEGGLSELMKGQLPEFVCKNAERIMGVSSVYTAGFKDSNMAKGGIVVLMRNNKPLLNSKPIEAALGYVSELLKRLLAEEELHAVNQQLQASEQQLKAFNQELRAKNQQLTASEKELKAAKEKAEINEKYYHTILNNMGDAVFVKDDQSRLILVNDAFCKMLNLDRSAMIGKTLAEEVTPEERESFLRIDKEVIQTGKENINEETITVQGKQTRTISTRKTCFVNDRGEKFLVGVVRDITERAKEERITKAKNKISQIIQSKENDELFVDTLDAVLQIMKSKHGVFGYINHEGDLVCPSMTKDIWEECKMTDKAVVFPKDTWGNSIWGNGLRNKKGAYSNKSFKIPEGHLPVERFLTVPLVYKNTSVGLISVGNKATDYSDDDFNLLQEIADYLAPVIAVQYQRKQVMESLAESNILFEKAQAMGKVASFEYNIITQKYIVSNEGKRIYGYSEEIKDFNPGDVWKCIPDLERVQKAWVDLIEKDKPYNLEHEIRPVTGPKSKTIKAIAEVVKDKAGNPIKVVGFIQDITELKKAQIELQSAYQQLQANEQQLRASNQQLEASEQQLRATNQQLAANEQQLRASNQHLIANEQELREAKKQAEENEKQLKLFSNNLVNGMIYQVAMLDKNKRKFNYVSEAVTNLYGCTAEQAMENPDLIYSKIHPDDIEGLIAKEKEAFLSMAVFKAEVRVINPNGSIRWSYFISKPRIINGLVCWDGLEIDITDRKQAEVRERIHHRNIEILSNTAMKFVEFPKESNIYDFLGEQVREFVGKDSYIVVNSVDTKTGISKIHSVIGAGKIANIITSKLGRDPIGMEFYVQDTNMHFTDGKLHVYEEGLYGILLKTVPKSVCKSIEKLAGINKIYIIDLAKQEQLFGSVIIFLKEKTGEIKNKQIIETFIKQASIAILKKQTEEKLVDSEERLNLAIKGSNDAPWDWHLITDELFYSEQWWQQIGYNPNEIPSNSSLWERLMHPDDKPRVDEIFEEALKNGLESYAVEFRLLHKQGYYVPVLSRGYITYDKDKKPIRVSGTNLDLTERKRFEQLIISAKERAEKNEKELLLAKEIVEKNTEMIINSQSLAHICSYSTNLDLNNIEKSSWVCSPEFYKIFGIDKTYPHTIAGWANFIHPDCREKMVAYHESVIKNRSSFNHEYKIIRINDGVERWVHGTGELVYDDQGMPVRMHGAIQDITERKKIEDELIKAKEKAEESDRLKSAFLSNMSHEIRTPMNGILGFTTLLLSPNLSDDTRERYIEIIHKSGNRMLNTVNDIIEISKIEAGLAEVKISEVDMIVESKNLIDFFQPQAQLRNLILSFKSELSSSIILTDRSKFESILTNLIRNAIKYTNKGIIELSYGIQDGFVSFYVKDTGIGIPQNRINAIFNRFEQADIEDKQVYEGSGLGLAITKSYVEMLGGKIWVESVQGKGSCFCFTIPYFPKTIEPDLKIQDKTTENNKKPLSQIKILIVEDDKVSADFLEIILYNVATNIIIANSGEKAIEILKDNTDIDIVLMDIKMPGINGFDATKTIRAFNKDVIIIAQTAYALSGDKEKAMEAGCNDYIAKPVIQTELIELIAKHLGARQSETHG